MFHLELRQFPHVTRAFNLSPEELQRRFVGPWVREQTVEFDERRWSPEKAKMTIYEGPALRPDEIGLGRGWGNVTRASTEVTNKVLREAEQSLTPTGRGESVSELKLDVIQRVAREPLRFGEVIGMASARHPGRRASERLALAEQAVWELLHEGRLQISRGGEQIPKTDWESLVLRWETWAPGLEDPPILLELS